MFAMMSPSSTKSSMVQAMMKFNLSKCHSKLDFAHSSIVIVIRLQSKLMTKRNNIKF